jgi:hypothetical protein
LKSHKNIGYSSGRNETVRALIAYAELDNTELREKNKVDDTKIGHCMALDDSLRSV